MIDKFTQIRDPIFPIWCDSVRICFDGVPGRVPAVKPFRRFRHTAACRPLNQFRGRNAHVSTCVFVDTSRNKNANGLEFLSFQIGTPTCSVLKNEVCLTDNVADILSLSILYRLLPLEE